MPRLHPIASSDTHAATLRVVSIPAGHPYPRAVRHDAGPQLHVVDDPDPQHPDRPAVGRWWPHRALEPAWLATRDLDLLHLHFGFDHRSPAELAELVDHLRARGCPLVLTVHDLRSPHQPDPATLDRQLDVLVPAADAVLTLTPWAGDRIHERWGRCARVVAHPPLADPAVSRRLRAGRADRHARHGGAPRPVVGVAAKSLRPNCDPVRLLPALEDAVHRHHARLRVTVHAEVLTDDAAERRRTVRALEDARTRGVEVVAHQPWSDDDLWRELADQDVAVLPYRFGTHSGWLEACHDVGTHVVAPGFGGYADQGADAVFGADEDGVDDQALVDAVGAVVDRVRAGCLAGDEADEQVRRSRHVWAVHEQVYRSVLRSTPEPEPVLERLADVVGSS